MTNETSDQRLGVLVLVATPIGNLGDLSPRAVEELRLADSICCEDTRRTRALLSASGIPAKGRLLSLHDQNERSRIPGVLSSLEKGRRVVVVSDAGTPGISDPGQALVAAAAAEGFLVSVVPGPTSIVAALVVSGLPTDRFCVEGFLPRRGSKRVARLDALAVEERTSVILEAPGRVADTLGDLLRSCGPRQVTVVRELTKVHEEIWRGDLEEAVAVFGTGEARGEYVIVLGGGDPPEAPSDEDVGVAVRAMIEKGAGVRETADAVAASLGVPRRRAYALATEERAKAASQKAPRTN